MATKKKINLNYGPNKELMKALTGYSKLKKSPGYAVFINGKWGSGKTFFIKRAIEDWKQDNSKIIYLSLYDISELRKIDNLILLAIGRISGSKAVSGIKTVSKVLIKGASEYIEEKFGIDISSLGIESGDLLAHFDFSEYMLIFDDFERSQIPKLELLGYLNNFVEHKNSKVIMIGDEENIDDKEEYQRIKEKTVGKSYCIYPDYDSAFSHFLNNVSKEILLILTNYQHEIKDCYEASGYSNLRILDYTIQDFARFILCFSDKHRSNPSLLRTLVIYFFILSLEYRCGKLGDIDSSIPDIMKYSLNEIVYPDVHPVSNIKKEMHKKYPILASGNKPLACDNIWVYFLKYDTIPKDLLEEDKKNNPFFDNRPDWLKLWEWNQLEDGEFIEVLGRIFKRLDGREIEDPREFLHVCGTLLLLSKIKILPIGEKEIFERCSKTIDSCVIGDISIESEIREGYPLGHGYHGYESHSFPMLKDRILENINTKKEEHYKNQATAMIQKLKDGEFTEFYRDIAQMPCVSYMDVKSLARAWSDTPNKDKYCLYEGFETRYKNNPSFVSIEKNFLQSLTNELSLLEFEDLEDIGSINNYYNKRLMERIHTILEFNQIEAEGS